MLSWGQLLQPIPLQSPQPETKDNQFCRQEHWFETHEFREVNLHLHLMTSNSFCGATSYSGKNKLYFTATIVTQI